MTTATITLEHVCSGGGHLRFSISIDGGASQRVNTDIANLQDAITDEDKIAFLKTYIRLYKQGRTWNQVKTAFQTGVQVTA